MQQQCKIPTTASAPVGWMQPRPNQPHGRLHCTHICCHYCCRPPTCPIKPAALPPPAPLLATNAQPHSHHIAAQRQLTLHAKIEAHAAITRCLCCCRRCTHGCIPRCRCCRAPAVRRTGCSRDPCACCTPVDMRRGCTCARADVWALRSGDHEGLLDDVMHMCWQSCVCFAAT